MELTENKKQEVVGYKSKYAIFSYCFPASVLVVLIAAFFAVFFTKFINSGQKSQVAGAVVAVIVLLAILFFFIILAIMTIRCPNELIAITDSEIILLSKNKTFSFKDINFVTYKLTGSKNGRHGSKLNRFGKIIIKTKSGEEYTQKFVASAPLLSRQLNSLLEKAKKEQIALKKAASKKKKSEINDNN